MLCTVTPPRDRCKFSVESFKFVKVVEVTILRTEEAAEFHPWLAYENTGSLEMLSPWEYIEISESVP